MTPQRKARPGRQKRAAGKRKSDGIRAIPYKNVKRETVEWFWGGLIPYGMLTLLVGDPGLGKSMLTVHLAAKASRDGINSILLSAEDHKGATIRPRLEAADADLELVHHIEVRREGIEEGLALPDDAAKLDQIIRRTKTRLVVVDPLTAHLPESINSWHDQSVRRALAPLHRSAEKRGCAIVVVAHLNKGGGQDPLYRTGGSIGLPAAVRSALLLARDPNDPEGERGSQRVLAHIKCNVGPQSGSQSCEIKSVTLKGRGAATAPHLEITGPSSVGGRELLNAGGEEASQRHGAEEFLRAELSAGSRPTADLQAAAKDAGHSWRTVERAKEKLGVKAKRVGGKGRKGKSGGGKGRWEWEL
jgi:AAA domain-containing protein